MGSRLLGSLAPLRGARHRPRRAVGPRGQRQPARRDVGQGTASRCSEGVQTIGKILGKCRDDVEGRTRRRMLEDELPGMQPGTTGVGDGPWLPVGPVPDDRMSDRLHVDTDLMGPPRLERCGQQRHTRQQAHSLRL